MWFRRTNTVVTAPLRETLCRSCRYAEFLCGFAPGESLTFCTYPVWGGLWVPFYVRECSGYSRTADATGAGFVKVAALVGSGPDGNGAE